MTNPDIRAAFEAWANDPNGGNWEIEPDDLKLNPKGEYMHHGLRNDWRAWQAGIAHAEAAKAKTEAARQPAPVAKPCGWIQIVNGKQTQNFARDEQELALIKEISCAIDSSAKVEYMPVYAALAATAAPVLMPEGVTIKAFQAAHDNAWHITIKHPFGESFVRMSNQRDIQFAELIAATRSQP